MRNPENEQPLEDWLFDHADDLYEAARERELEEKAEREQELIEQRK